MLICWKTGIVQIIILFRVRNCREIIPDSLQDFSLTVPKAGKRAYVKLYALFVILLLGQMKRGYIGCVKIAVEKKECVFEKGNHKILAIM